MNGRSAFQGRAGLGNDWMKQESFERCGPVQRRQTETLGDENSRLASLLDVLDVGVNVQDHDHNILYQNRFFRTLFGDPGGKCFQLYERRDRPCDDCPAAETLRTGRSLQTERPVIDRQGNRRLLVLTTTLLKGWNGKPAVCEIIRDITVQPQSRPPWEISEESYRYLIESVNEGICIVQDGRIVFINHEAMRMADSPLDAIIGRPFVDFIHPEDREPLRERIRRHLAGDNPPDAYSYRLVTREGLVRWVELRISLITWKGRPATLNFVHDITDSKRTEEALRQSEERFRGIFENAIEGIFQTRRDGRFVSVNPSLARLLGASSPDALLRDPDLRVTQFYADPRHREEMLRILLKEGRDVRNFETQFRRLDGSVVWVSINSRFSRSTDLEPMVDGTVEDISARKSLELQLLHSQKLDAIGTMAGGIAHDFNNILGIIIGYAEIIKSRKLPATHKAQGDLERVLQAALRARDLVKQILNFSRQEERAMRMTEIRPLVKEAVRMLRATLPATVRIRSSIQTQDEMILGDPTQVYQVLINLCTNAAHAMRNTVGTLSICLETVAFSPGEILPHPNLRPGLYQRLSVGDTGEGIDPAILGRIFEPFFTTKAVQEGSGLGLSVVHGIVKAHRGAVTVESEQGKGATFHIFFPVVMQKAVEKALPSPDASLSGHGRVLLVDDEQLLAEMTAEMLTNAGYKVTVMNHPMDAIDWYGSHASEVDLVITDQTMPDMTGMKMIEELRKLEPDLPVILCTGYSESVTQEIVQSLGIKLVMKPVLIRDMVRAIKALLAEGGPHG